MMRMLLLIAGVAFFAGHAIAQNPQIIINPDGSVVVNGEMPPLAPPSVSPPVPPSPRAAPVAETVVEESVPAATPHNVAPPPGRKPRYVVTKPKPEPAPELAPVPLRDSVDAPQAAPVPAALSHSPVIAAPQALGPITREDARRIALTVAPPSRGVQVYPADFNGLAVYEVIFKTENGEVSVLVDRETGEIVNPKKKKGKKK